MGQRLLGSVPLEIPKFSFNKVLKPDKSKFLVVCMLQTPISI